jgi:hypothetical protein
VVASAGRPLVGKAIAGRIRMDYNPKIRYILANLLEREALTHSSEGYSIAEQTSGEQLASTSGSA